MEVPYFGDNPGKRRREINLGGGSTSAATHASLMHDAKARRQQRTEAKRRQENAIKIQSWWRGRQEAAVVRKELRTTYEQNVTNLTGLRCLVLIGKDDDLLVKWSNAVAQDQGGMCIVDYAQETS